MRSVAVHVALEQSFFNPFETVQAYLWRNALIHGAPTRHVNEKELVDIAEDREIWAFRVLSDYLRLAADRGFDSIEQLVAHLDAEQGDHVCEWLVTNGGDEVVEEYRDMLSRGRSG